MKTKANSCTGKARHATRIAAIVALKAVNNHGLSGYACRFCKGWHLGNNRKKFQLRLDQLLSDAPTKYKKP
jgi:hypothetical protein